MSKQLAVEQLDIADWIKDLAAIPDRNFTLETVQDYILHHAIRPESLEKYLFFSKGSYTRNLIFKNDMFECMAICWEVGQFSRIHNHRAPTKTFSGCPFFAFSCYRFLPTPHSPPPFVTFLLWFPNSATSTGTPSPTAWWWLRRPCATCPLSPPAFGFATFPAAKPANKT